MSKIPNIDSGNEKGMRRQSPTVFAAALRELDHARSDAIDVVELTHLIEEAIEAHRRRAFERCVRISFCVLDDIAVFGNEREIATRLETMLAAGIEMAAPGTHMECNAVPQRRGVVVRVRFMRPAKHPQGESEEIVGGEIAACWPKVEDL